MKKRIISVAIFALVFIMVTLPGAWAEQLSISTGSMGGGFYAIGGGMASYISRNIDEVNLTAVSSGGVFENLGRLDSGKAHLALLSTGDAHAGYRGMAPYKKKYDGIRGLGILFSNWGEPYCLKKSGIKTYLDLKGKTVNGAAPGGSMHKLFYDWVKAHGMNPEKDFKTVFMPTAAVPDALKMGQIDAAMEIAAIPTPVLTELSLTEEIQIIQFAPGVRDKLVKAMPKYLPMVIPGGTYRGIDKDIETVGMAAIWACRADLPDDLVYNIVKAIYSPEGLAYLGKVHPAGKAIKLENAANFEPIPFHPGAIKFFKEAGVLK